MGSCVFTNGLERIIGAPAGGIGLYMGNTSCKLKDYGIIDIDYDFGSEAAYFTCLVQTLNKLDCFLGYMVQPTLLIIIKVPYMK